GLGQVQGAAPQPEVQLLVGAPLDLVLDQPREELDMRPLLGDRLLVAHLQGVEDAREAQPLELGAELVARARHRAPPRSAAMSSPAWRARRNEARAGAGADCGGSRSSPRSRTRRTVG